MKCPNCGAEIEQGSKSCSFCNTVITVEMQKSMELLNKTGCPKCNSTNVTFKRENQGEVRGKNGKIIVHSTVGFCKDCGYTWNPNATAEKPKEKNKTWLWVLGWIFIFPVPLTILMLRRQDMKQNMKYGIIAAAWILYLLILIAAPKNKNKKDIKNTNSNLEVTTAETAAEKVTAETTTENQNTDNAKEDLKKKVDEISQKYNLKMEITGLEGKYDIVQIYGQKEDFENMKSAYLEISKYIDDSLTDEEMGKIFDENIGVEGGVSDPPGELNNLIFSAPNDVESWYRVDIYTTRYINR